MKTRNSILMALVIFASIALSSCGGGSVKGKWSESDKKEFYKLMDGMDLSNFGEHKSAWIDCYFEKAQATFSSFNEANGDIEGCEKISEECGNEILSSGSEKGNWSDEDKNSFYEAMEGVDMTNMGEHKDEWIECYLQKAEAKYSSFNDANVDESGCEKIALECNDEIMN